MQSPKVKARTVIYLDTGESIRLPDTLETLIGKWGFMQRMKPGSLFEFERVTGHGAVKRVFVPVQRLTHFGET